ncbi:MAG TPA: hypothetical protein P5218_15900 [Planctomycetota bacterium]|nr:hypothetical protein [Planctomycetota bacterium]
MTTHSTLAAATLDLRVEGRHLAAGTLGGVLGEGATLLVFLRHLG